MTNEKRSGWLNKLATTSGIALIGIAVIVCVVAATLLFFLFLNL